jgi:hypothetical protein
MKAKKNQYHKLFIKGFFTGIGTAAGATFGFTLLIALIGYIFRTLDTVPLIGQFVGQVTQYAQDYLNTK